MRFVVFALTLASIGCASTDENPACAFDLHATYTATTLPDGRPRADTLEGMLGSCELSPDKRWKSECRGDVLVFECGPNRVTYRVVDANADGYIVRIESSAGLVRLVEGS